MIHITKENYKNYNSFRDILGIEMEKCFSVDEASYHSIIYNSLIKSTILFKQNRFYSLVTKPNNIGIVCDEKTLTCSMFKNSISGVFTHPKARKVCSIVINDSGIINSFGCHSFQGRPESVLCYYSNKTFGVERVYNSDEITQPTIWALGGMGLLGNYSPAIEGFTIYRHKRKIYNYIDVRRLTNHNVVAVDKNNNIHLIFCKAMTASSINKKLIEYGYEFAVLIDGGDMSAFNSKEIEFNTLRNQGCIIYAKE